MAVSIVKAGSVGYTLSDFYHVLNLAVLHVRIYRVGWSGACPQTEFDHEYWLNTAYCVHFSTNFIHLFFFCNSKWIIMQLFFLIGFS